MAPSINQTANKTLNEAIPHPVIQGNSDIDLFEGHFFEMMTAIGWGLASHVTNEALKKIPCLQNSSKTRAFIAVAMGAGATWAVCQYGLKKDLDLEACKAIALKAGILGGAWKMTTASFQVLRNLSKKPKEIEKQVKEISSNEKIQNTPFTLLIEAIREKTGEEGIFRIPGEKTHINTLVDTLKINPTKEAIEKAHIHTQAGALKKIIRDASPRLFDPIKEELLKIEKPSESIDALKSLVQKLGGSEREQLHMLVSLLAEVAAESSKNKMTAQTLSTCMALNLYTECNDQLPSSMRSPSEKRKTTLRQKAVKKSKEWSDSFRKKISSPASKKEVKEPSKKETLQELNSMGPMQELASMNSILAVMIENHSEIFG